METDVILVNNDSMDCNTKDDSDDTDIDWDYGGTPMVIKNCELNCPQRKVKHYHPEKNAKKLSRKRSQRQCKLTYKKDTVSCNNCGGTFKSRIRLKAHRLTCCNMDEHFHPPNKDINDLHAPALSKRRGRPVKVKHESLNELCCRYCDKVFKKRRNVIRHERIHTGEKPYACPECDRRFSDDSTLRQHIRTHSSEVHFLCTNCGKFFKSRNGLKNHKCSSMVERHDDGVTEHHGLGIQTSRRCAAMNIDGMKTRDSMNEDGYSFHQNPLQCRYCSKLFRKRRNVARHERIHTGEKPYSCEVCGRQFSDQSTLRQHANVHNEKMFLCDDCGKPFRSRNGLKYHRCSIYILYKKPPISRLTQLLRPSNYHPRQFTRSSAEKSFFSADNSENGGSFDVGGKPVNLLIPASEQRLSLPLMTGGNPLECKYCGRTFTNRQRVMRHERVHTGEKPYKCMQCERNFADESTLRQHSRIHSVTLSACTECGKSFRSRNGLRFHRCFVYLVNPRSKRSVDRNKGVSEGSLEIPGKCQVNSGHSEQHEAERLVVGEYCIEQLQSEYIPTVCSVTEMQLNSSLVIQNNLSQIQGESSLIQSTQSNSPRLLGAVLLAQGDSSRMQSDSSLIQGDMSSAYDDISPRLCQPSLMQVDSSLTQGDSSRIQEETMPMLSDVSLTQYDYSDIQENDLSLVRRCGSEKTIMNHEYSRMQHVPSSIHDDSCGSSHTEPCSIELNEQDEVETPSDNVNGESGLAEKENGETVELNGLIDVMLPALIQSKNPKNVFMCVYCPKTFTKRDHLTRHERSHTGERPYSCSHCAKRFGDRSTLRQHALLVHSSRLPYECKECGSSFQVRQQLKLHRRSHLGVSLHVCSLCGGQFLSRLGLLRHQSQTHNEGIYDITANKETLPSGDTHSNECIVASESVDLQQDSPKKTIQCSYCSLMFAYGDTARRHERIHTGEKPYSCGVCSKRFADRSTLWQHSRLHTGLKPFSCQVCGLTFRWRKTLLFHECEPTTGVAQQNADCLANIPRDSSVSDVQSDDVLTDLRSVQSGSNIHVGPDPSLEGDDRLFRCSYCPKTFAKRHHTLRHEMIHSGVKPYRCSVCAMQFNDTSTLRQHMRVHTGETPYRCDHCGKSFRWRNGFRTHSCLRTRRADNGTSTKRQLQRSRRNQQDLSYETDIEIKLEIKEDEELP